MLTTPLCCPILATLDTVVIPFLLSVHHGQAPQETAAEAGHSRQGVADEIQQELASFNASSLKHTETQEKVLLPSKEDVQQEKIHNSLLEGVEQFEKTSMKHAHTQEKVCLPKKEGIETFDPSKLKHAETSVKNPLPTKEGNEAE
ncbi:hypothetical protein HPB51_011068 [Rhipicephalus microplus]|uniref:Uncharacterized protein n=1 Tax=Rhipicephalus microplus TaxID=6941 RepID=A0A9J6DUW0_RHIMP|nr:hypothetical protein HPB51_011068 [Rhipicephalus microplus]